MVMQHLMGAGSGKKEAELRIQRLLRQGDPRAIDLMYERFAPALLGVLRSMVQRNEVAEDLLQEVFVKIWKSAGSYNPDKASLFTWSLVISKSIALDYLRTKGKRQLDQLGDVAAPGNEPSYCMDQAFDHLGAVDFFRKLGDSQRRILYRIYMRGETHVEVAQRMQIPLGTVKTRLRSSLFLFRSFLESRGKHATPHEKGAAKRC